MVLFIQNLYPQAIQEREDLIIFFDEENIEGSVLLYDLNKDAYLTSDKERLNTSFIPASTFKIFNTLVGLELGIIHDPNYIFKWDGIESWNKNWNKDLKLKEAFQYSCVPCYQALAREIGEERMQLYIDKENYGNKNISGGIDQFWLSGEIRISQLQQIEFLKKLYFNELGFSKANMEIVKEIMILEDSENFQLRGKTGWGIIEGTNYGWFVGYMEKEDNVIFFALNIESDDPPQNFASARLNIIKKILAKLF